MSGGGAAYPSDIEGVVAGVVGSERVAAFAVDRGGVDGLVVAFEGPPGRAAEARDAVRRAFGLEPVDVVACEPGALGPSREGARRRYVDGALRRVEARAAGGATEDRLVAMWRRLLSADALTSTDSVFLAFGATSMAASRAATEIEAQFGVRVEPSMLLAHDTAQLQARYIGVLAASGPGASSNVLPLHPRGSRVPLVLVHPAGGEVFPYVPLVRALDPDRPVYAIESPERASDELFLTNPVDTARYYVRQLLEVLPEGPCHLCGWSFGGVAAFEMASALAARGRPVQSVVLLDTRAPSTFAERQVETAQTLLLRSVVRRTQRAAILDRVLPGRLAKMSPIRRFLAGLYLLDLGMYLSVDDLRRSLAFALPAEGIDGFPGDDVPTVLARGFEALDASASDVERQEFLFGYTPTASLRRARIFAKNDRITAPYAPARAFAGDLRMLRVGDNPKVLGWQRFATAPMRVVDLDIVARPGLGKHMSMLDEVNVPAVAGALTAALADADTHAPS